MMAKRERDKETPEEIRQAFRVFDKVPQDGLWLILIVIDRTGMGTCQLLS